VLLLNEGLVEHIEVLFALDFLSDLIENGLCNTFLELGCGGFFTVVNALDDLFHLVHDDLFCKTD